MSLPNLAFVPSPRSRSAKYNHVIQEDEQPVPSSAGGNYCWIHKPEGNSVKNVITMLCSFHFGQVWAGLVHMVS